MYLRIIGKFVILLILSGFWGYLMSLTHRGSEPTAFSLTMSFVGGAVIGVICTSWIINGIDNAS